VLGSIVAQVAAAQLAKHHTIVAEKAGGLRLTLGRPAR